MSNNKGSQNPGNSTTPSPSGTRVESPTPREIRSVERIGLEATRPPKKHR